MKKRGQGPPMSALKTRGALVSIFYALDGEPGALAARLRQGTASREEMAIAADLIEKKIKPRRPKSWRMDRLAIAHVVRDLKELHPKWQRKRIISEAVDFFKKTGSPVSARHVYNALDEFDDNALTHLVQMPAEAEADSTSCSDLARGFRALSSRIRAISFGATVDLKDVEDVLATIQELASSLARK